ncbi:MAG: cache domain-containing protein, partial [Patescibacteria group bacterium]|nr:cache domain-containing protein [Patescibacteria group bacterium]
MNPCRRSLTCRMVALILLGAGFVLLLVVGVSYTSQRRRVVNDAVDHGAMLTHAVVQRIEASFGRAESIVQQNALFLGDGQINRRETAELIRRTLEAHPSLFGMAVALSKQEAEKNDFNILYGWQHEGAVAVDNRPAPEEDYRHDWYRLPSEKQAPVWIEPYFDEQADAAMVTYSVPVVRDGTTIAVVTCDLSLDGIRSMIDALALEGGGFAVLLSGKGTFISHPQDELEIVETVFSLADAQNDHASAETLRHLGRSLLSGKPGWLRYQRPFGKE